MDSERYLIPDWPAPKNVRALVTTRRGGVSQGAFSSFNLGIRSGDQSEHVAANRQTLTEDCNWIHRPQWLKQVHGIGIVQAKGDDVEREGDAVWTSKASQPCIVLTADCLPVIFCDRQGSTVAAAHAGWKGLLAGVLEETVRAMLKTKLKTKKAAPGELMAWLGPAISQRHFEVGPEVRSAFIKHSAEASEGFAPGREDRWMGDLYLLARQRLQAIGLGEIHGGGFCTYEDSEKWFSYRRDGQQSGRLATAIWFEQG